MPISNSKKVSQKGLSYERELIGYSPAFKYLWRVYKQSCLRRNVSWELSPQEFEKLLKSDCEYCGQPPLNMTKVKAMTHQIHYNGLDRIDNSKAYTINNVVSCCKTCNSMKSKLSVEDFLNHACAIVSFQEVKKDNLVPTETKRSSND